MWQFIIKKFIPSSRLKNDLCGAEFLLFSELMKTVSILIKLVLTLVLVFFWFLLFDTTNRQIS